MLLFSSCVLLATLYLCNAQSLTSGIHRTQAATERVNDLWCYQCDTMEDGEACSDLLAKNTSTSLIKKCKADEFVCMVKRFSYTTSTENMTSNPKMWSLDRRCSVNCEPGCIIIGERTKLYACTSCCEKALCNIGRGSGSTILDVSFRHFLFLFFNLVLSKTYQEM